MADFWLMVLAAERVVGRGAVLVGLVCAGAVPVGGMLLVVEALYPGGVVGLVGRLVWGG